MPVDIDEALKLTGGYGGGRFAVLAFSIVVIGMLSTGFILYNLNFLELAP